MSSGIVNWVVNKVRVITFNNSRKKNALSAAAYSEITSLLNKDATNDKIIATIFTGEGEYFTSGNDLSAKSDADYEETVNDFHTKFVNMVHAFLNYPKLIVTVVNGPAIGIGFTLTALSDIVYASNTATFAAPFVKLGLCIEGCGSYLMPRIMGKSKAAEVMLLGKKMDAQEAVQYNLAAAVIPVSDVKKFIDETIITLCKLPMEQVMFNKKLISDGMKTELLNCAKREADLLLECMTSEYFITNMMNFMSRKKSKL